MAGIGFELRRLVRRDDLLGVVQGYGYSVLISTGPWIFTTIALMRIEVIGAGALGLDATRIFRAVVVYNFIFSMVLSGPMTLVLTRFLSDRIFAKDVRDVPGSMLMALVMFWGISAPIVLGFYFGFTDLPIPTALAASFCYMAIGGVWVCSVFLSALKDYMTVAVSYALGLALAVLMTALLIETLETTGMILGFALGMGAILFFMISRVLVEYPYPIVESFAYLAYFKSYWELALTGAIASSATWIDKWVMWFVPQRGVIAQAMINYAPYEGATFLAYLTIIPGIAVFVVSVETDFFEKYHRFYFDIRNNSPFAVIEENRKALIDSMLHGGANLLVLQGALSTLAILLAPQIIDFTKGNLLQVGMFRFGVLGAFFHLMMIFCMTILTYFDLRREVLYLHILFLFANGLLTWWTLGLGFPYYGYGFFLAALLCFLASYAVLVTAMARLPYLAFIGNNPSIK